ncbi:MAG: sulfoxide reductase heme-binding subunit YedZ, partial [Gammaproteobacteria bacterium HGW-Gammaproteobacteria-7]
KADLGEPLIYATVLAILLGLRLMPSAPARHAASR